VNSCVWYWGNNYPLYCSYIAALLDINSVDSRGWRNRAACGIIQLPGKGDRIVADLGNPETRIRTQ
jgi:hypothetical protein